MSVVDRAGLQHVHGNAARAEVTRSAFAVADDRADAARAAGNEGNLAGE